MANGMEERIDALSGGAPLPQAATQTIARRLLGPAVADRWGDVIGARPTGLQDVARDFSIGFISGDPTKADELKMRVMQGYREELTREETAARQREADARAQLQGFFNLLEQGKKVPKELRQDFFKEGLPKLGVEPTSPLFLKVLSNYEKFGDVYDALGDPEIQRLADEDPLAAVEQLVAMGHDGAQALQVAQSVQQMKRYRAETQRMIAQTRGLEQRAAQDPTEKARAAFVSRMAGRTVKDRLGRQRLLSPDEILAMADRFYPQAAAPGLPQEEPAPASPAAAPEAPAAPGAAGGAAVGGALAGIPQEEGPVTTETAGIPQAATQSAEAGKQKVRRITGTVTRVE